MVDGSLPAGVDLGPTPDDGRSGTTVESVGFTGGAIELGRSTATIEVCPVAIVFTCRHTDLTVNVVEASSGSETPAPPTTRPEGEGQLPATGAANDLAELGALALAMIVAGAAAAGRARTAARSKSRTAGR